MSFSKSKPIKLRTTLFIAAAIACVTLGVTMVTGPSTPSGSYDTSIVGHGSEDVRLVFRDGIVTIEGEEGMPDPLGTYVRAEMGEWMWSSAKTKWRLEPRWHGLKCVDMADTNNVFFLKRKCHFSFRK